MLDAGAFAGAGVPEVDAGVDAGLDDAGVAEVGGCFEVDAGPGQSVLSAGCTSTGLGLEGGLLLAVLWLRVGRRGPRGVKAAGAR